MRSPGRRLVPDPHRRAGQRKGAPGGSGRPATVRRPRRAVFRVGWVESSRPTGLRHAGGSRRLDPPYGLRTHRVASRWWVSKTRPTLRTTDPPGCVTLVGLEDSTHPTDYGPTGLRHAGGSRRLDPPYGLRTHRVASRWWVSKTRPTLQTTDPPGCVTLVGLEDSTHPTIPTRHDPRPERRTRGHPKNLRPGCDSTTRSDHLTVRPMEGPARWPRGTPAGELPHPAPRRCGTPSGTDGPWLPSRRRGSPGPCQPL